MQFRRSLARWLLLLVLLSSAAPFLMGCKTPGDSENDAPRPWGAPKYWEGGGGMMGGMNERR
jgi:hypothetical protein